MEDVFPIKKGDIPASYVSLPEGRMMLMVQEKKRLQEIISFVVNLVLVNSHHSGAKFFQS